MMDYKMLCQSLVSFLLKAVVGPTACSCCRVAAMAVVPSVSINSPSPQNLLSGSPDAEVNVEINLDRYI